ncbi:unnamed protein product, partial [Clonostachys rhizophaga]
MPSGSRPDAAVRNNGPDDLALERFKLRELAEEFRINLPFRSTCLHDLVWPCRIRGFITASQTGMDKGAFIIHRCHGASTDINIEATRAVIKLKATITQRVKVDDVEFDVEADCRFCFYFEKVDGKWGARLVRHWYEKDKMILNHPTKGLQLEMDEDKLNNYPAGYKYLSYWQEITMGVRVLTDMPGHRRRIDTLNLKKHDELY